MANKKFVNLHIQLSGKDVDTIDEWKAENGMRSRSEVLRHMIKIATASSNAMQEKASIMLGNLDSPDDSKENIEDYIKKVVKRELEKKVKK